MVSHGAATADVFAAAAPVVAVVPVVTVALAVRAMQNKIRE